MRRIFKPAFTVVEVLLTLAVIGIISILVLPNILRDIHNKARISLLKSTVIGVNDVVHQEITASHTDDIMLTKLYTSPDDFWEEFDIAENGDPFAAANSYISYNGDAAEVTIPNNSVLLKNGVGIGIVNRLFEKESTGVIVDVTGSNPPNTIGVDYFIFEIVWNSNDEEGIHVGDVHGYYNGGSEGDETNEGLKEDCEEGNGAACYRLAELSGFDHEYLE